MNSRFSGKELGKHCLSALQECTSSKDEVLDTSSPLQEWYGLVGESLEFNPPDMLLIALT